MKFDLLDAEEQVADPVPGEVPATDEGTVSFSHVQFGYTPDKQLMHDFNFTVEPGQKVAIVGPTGAGKTTLVNLLMRFYEVDGGNIVVDGVSTRDMTREDAYARYDAVVHLVTAAIGAEKFFSHETNEHRLEGVEEAIRVDDALRAGWAGHPNLQVIDNTGTFEDKLNRAVAGVLALIDAL